jgi:hypothetical protein
LSLAEPVKRCLHTFLLECGISNGNEYLWGDKKEEVIPGIGVTGGYLMSSFATDYMRNMIKEDVWLSALLRHVKPGHRYIVDDMRFSNEYAAFDIKVIVVRPGFVNHSRSAISEGQLDDFYFDYTIVNDGSFEKLEQQTREVIDDILKKGDR